ncbi:hypothetical protein PGH07_04350 [Sulfurovum sp. zt1-1]|uniref:ATP-grasp domain-containing protein n=1 Tax=Sulfurovum zhangzhouensis TaxID=3019067 RepID=A0ABT7QX39_9BACT|nr:hypothetical protein [Sulfurovum zhangzhouensis]MDM5271399.1 hypothetical protein [Sulfurovum zhangzhouensis]
MAKKNILFINGIPDDACIRVDKFNQNGNFEWGGSGSSNLSDFLQNDVFDRTTIIFDTKQGQILPRIKINAVFNQVSDADSHKIVLEKLQEFYRSVSAHMPFYNPPANIMKTTRDNIYQTLKDIPRLNVPKTIKIQPRSPSDIHQIIKDERFEYPVIFRQAGDHGGISTIRVDGETEQFNAFALDGRDYYLTQFVNYLNSDGVYAKYRLIIINGEVFIRHAIFGQEWMVHAGSQIEKKRGEEYKNLVAKRFNEEIKPNIQPIITEMYNRLGLDYFGMDCNIDNEMNILVFEVNANMNVFTISKDSIFKPHIDAARQALIKMLAA